jgi:hypothetical protein
VKVLSLKGIDDTTTSDEVKRQVGTLLVEIGFCYIQYCRKPELLKRNISVMLYKTKRLVKNLEKICRDEGIL